MLANQFDGEARKRDKMSALDGTEESSHHGTEETGMEERREVSFGGC